MIDQLKEAAKGADLNDLALDIEKLFLERLKSLSPDEQVEPMMMIFSFLTARALYRCSQELEIPALRTFYLLPCLPAWGEDFKARLDRIAAEMEKDLFK